MNFECTRCGTCCRGEPGYVWLRESDIDDIADFLGMPRDEAILEYVRGADPRYSLKELRNGDCVFWNDGCKIYLVRPPQCRSFPFWKENIRTAARWKVLAEECPGVDSGKRHHVSKMGTESAFIELGNVYRRAEQELARLGLSCRACGKCCHFTKSGHDLFATLLEVYYLVDRAGIPARPVIDDVCPYLNGDDCSVHEYRTLGCRTFFCKDGANRSFEPIYEKYRKEIDNICTAYALPADYALMSEILRPLQKEIKS